MMQNLERIEHEAARLNALIGQLLRLSSMESTDARIDTEEFSLNHLLEEVLPDAEFEARQRFCRITLKSTCHCVVRGNAELIYRAVENIMRNAIRYTEEASSVELALHCETKDGHPVSVLQISDRGPGLPENELQNIFRPFYRVDSARQRDTGGFGIGLAIAERAIRLHHGEVSAANRTGGGITITVMLPCYKSSHAGEDV
jgi:two-component system sensor histidine kinase CpxA